MTISLISRESQAFIDNRKNRVLARRNEIFANLARKSEWPPFPDTRQRRVFELILTGLGAGCGLGLSCLLLITAVVWVVLRLIDWPFLLTVNGLSSGVFVFFFAFLSFFFLLMGIVRVPQIHAQMNYPIKLTQTFDDLKANGQLIPGEIIDVKVCGDRQILTYRLELRSQTMAVTGDYETTAHKAFNEGDMVMVLYLNPGTHILL